MVAVACLCGGVALDVQLELSTDSSILQLCHCSSCRTATGLLCASYYLLQREPRTLDGLREYRQPDQVSRFFCKTCGAHAFARVASGAYLVAAGVLDAKNAPQVRAIQHWQVADTGDGGLGALVAGAESGIASCRLSAGLDDGQGEGVQRRSCPHVRDERNETPDGHRKELHARCHCGGVEFSITPPDASSAEASSPYPDLLVPYHSGSSANPQDVKWWLRNGRTKYLAGTCACASCRLGSGFPIQAWAFIPKSNIFNADRTSLAYGRGTMQRYRSSPEVYREFCRRCGATVFWHCEERPTLIDVSIGLLRASGARAENWLEWATGRVSFAEMAVQKDLVRRLEDGLKSFGQSS